MTDNLIERLERFAGFRSSADMSAVMIREAVQALKAKDAALAAKDAEIERLKEASELLPEGEWTVELQEVERPDHHMLFAADSTDEAAERIATMEPEWRLIRIARKALGGRDGD